MTMKYAVKFNKEVATLMYSEKGNCIRCGKKGIVYSHFNLVQGFCPKCLGNKSLKRFSSREKALDFIKSLGVVREL